MAVEERLSRSFASTSGGVSLHLVNGMSPAECDVAFAPISSSRNPGQLNAYVMEELSHPSKSLPSKEDLSPGFMLRRAAGKASILFVVTVSVRTGRDSGHLLSRILYLAITAHAADLSGKKIWLPLMAAGSGGLSSMKSLSATLVGLSDGVLIHNTGWEKTEIFISTEERGSAFEGLANTIERVLEEIARSIIPEVKPTPPLPKTTPPPESTPLHLDTPSPTDHLNRAPFVEALAKRVEEIWQWSGRLGQTQAASSFMLHLYGPWGAGKSTLLNLLKDTLTGKTPSWIVIEFNAWKYQHLDPPWWALLDTVFRQGLKQFRLRAYDGAASGNRVWMGEYWRRLKAGKGGIWGLSAVVAFVMAVILATSLPSAGEDWKNLDTAVKVFSGLLTLIGSFWMLARSLSSSLLPGSEQAAQNYVTMSRDPFANLSDHFDALARSFKRPLAVYIDDLDRCRPEYVVNLLEGIQTHFRHSQVLFVVTADRHWLATCFETQYAPFVESANKPGQRLGYHFVEKAFQLSLRIPSVATNDQEQYLNTLLLVEEPGRDETPEKGAAQLEEVAQRHASLVSDTQVMEVIQDEIKKNTISPEVGKKAAMKLLTNRAVVRHTEHRLQRFLAYLDPNPRAMKRLVNAFSAYRLTVLTERNVFFDQDALARWLILSMRWPLLGEALEEHPHWVDAIKQEKLPDGMKDDHPLAALFTNKQVHSVAQGLGDDGPLTALQIRHCCGLKDNPQDTAGEAKPSV